jgi:hypothetical protein
MDQFREKKVDLSYLDDEDKQPLLDDIADVESCESKPRSASKVRTSIVVGAGLLLVFGLLAVSTTSE